MEESFKQLKSNLKLEKAHAKTLALCIQEVDARVLLDRITLRLQKGIKEPSYIYTLDTYVTQILNIVERVSNPVKFSADSETDVLSKRRSR